MPTISQLPAIDEVTAADTIPISHGGAAYAVSVGTLLEGTQPAILAESGQLLGRTSLGPGGPEPVAIGTGLALNGGTLEASIFDPAKAVQHNVLVATDEALLNSNGELALLPVSSFRSLFSGGANVSIDSNGTISAVGGAGSASTSYSISQLPSVATIASSDLVAISQGGTDHTISYSNLLDGLTIDLAQPAAAALDSDTFWVAQGGNTMLRQTLAAIWTWLIVKQPTYKLPVVEVAANVTLDGTIHNGRVLICSQPVTLSPAPVNMGDGFYCDVINLSGGIVNFGAGIITSSGSAALPSGQAAALRVATYSGGTIVFASIAGSSSTGTGTAPAAPGQVTGLSATNATSSSIALIWSTPASGGNVNSYTIQYRVTGNTTWSTFATGIAVTSATVTGLVAATSYDFQVYGVNAGGAGQPSAVATASTVAVPGSVVSVAWNMVPTGPYTHGLGSIGVNAHINPASATVQFGFSTSATVSPSNWVVGNYVNTDLWGAYVSTPASAGTWYAWVEGTDGSKPTVYPTPFTVT
jgi:hypothetical protein